MCRFEEPGYPIQMPWLNFLGPFERHKIIYDIQCLGNGCQSLKLDLGVTAHPGFFRSGLPLGMVTRDPVTAGCVGTMVSALELSSPLIPFWKQWILFQKMLPALLGWKETLWSCFSENILLKWTCEKLGWNPCSLGELPRGWCTAVRLSGIFQKRQLWDECLLGVEGGCATGSCGQTDIQSCSSLPLPPARPAALGLWEICLKKTMQGGLVNPGLEVFASGHLSLYHFNPSLPIC